MSQDTFGAVFGFTPAALVAYALLHLHLWGIYRLLSRRVERVERLPTASRELRELEAQKEAA